MPMATKVNFGVNFICLSVSGKNRKLWLVVRGTKTSNYHLPLAASSSIHLLLLAAPNTVKRAHGM
jgi:hypothetical protein